MAVHIAGQREKRAIMMMRPPERGNDGDSRFPVNKKWGGPRALAGAGSSPKILRRPWKKPPKEGSRHGQASPPPEERKRMREEERERRIAREKRRIRSRKGTGEREGEREKKEKKAGKKEDAKRGVRSLVPQFDWKPGTVKNKNG